LGFFEKKTGFSQPWLVRELHQAILHINV